MAHQEPPAHALCPAYAAAGHGEGKERKTKYITTVLIATLIKTAQTPTSKDLSCNYLCSKKEAK